jgi:histone H3/H4
MATESRDRLALELRMAGESLIARPSIDAYNTLSKMLAALNRAGLREQLLDPGTTVINGICDRFEQSGRITVEPEDAELLRQALADIDAGLHRVPLQRLARAVAEVEAFFALVDPSTKDK